MFREGISNGEVGVDKVIVPLDY